MGNCLSTKYNHKSQKGAKVHHKSCKNRHSFIFVWPRIRGKVWRLLTQKDRTVARCINQFFKKEVEILGGLHTKLTYKDPLCVPYLESVETTRCRFVDMKDEYFEDKDNKFEIFRCNFNVSKLDIIAMLSHKMQKHLILPMAKSLRYLEFRQMSLMTRYINPKPAEDVYPYEFSQLLTLTFNYGSLRRGGEDNFKIFNANMIYLLRLINAPELTCFNICPVHSVLSGIVLDDVTIPHEYLHWESTTLKSFIVRHRKSLRRLHITLLRTMLTPEDGYFVAPKSLTQYSCLIPRLCPEVYDTGDPQKEFFSNYWTAIAQESKELKSLCAQVENWGRVSRFRRSLRPVMKNNYATLTTILVNSYQTRHPLLHEHHLTLDMGLFSICVHLKVLHIRLTTTLKFNRKGQSESETYTAVGIEKLPKSLESLQLKNILCYTFDLLNITKLPGLTSCQLLHVGRKGNHGVTFEIAKLLFTHKRIHYVEIFGFNDENNPARIMALVKKFNDGLYEQHVEIHNPMKKIPFFDYLPCCCCMKPLGSSLEL